MTATRPREDAGWWSTVYPGLALPGQRSALSDLASHARDPKVQGRLVAGGIPSLAVDALRCAIPEPAGPAAAECWHVQAQAARLLANLAYLQENKPAVFGAGAAEALESAARAALSVHDRDVAADRAVGPAGEGEAERVEAVACILVEAAAALANLASGPSLRARCMEPGCTLLPLLLRLSRLRPDIGGEAVRAVSNLACMPVMKNRLCDLNAPRLLLDLLAARVPRNAMGGPAHPTAAWFTAAGWDVSLLVGRRTLACAGCLAGLDRRLPRQHTADGLGEGEGSGILLTGGDGLPPDSCPESASPVACDDPAAKLVEKILVALHCFLTSPHGAPPPAWIAATPELPSAVVALIAPRGLFSPWPNGTRPGDGDGSGAARIRISLEALRLSQLLVLTEPSLGVSLVAAGLLRAAAAVLRANPPALLATTVADVVFRKLLTHPAPRAATVASPWLPPLLLAAALVDSRAAAKPTFFPQTRMVPLGECDSAPGGSPIAKGDESASMRDSPLSSSSRGASGPRAPASAAEPTQPAGLRPGSAPLRSFRRPSDEGGSSPVTRAGGADGPAEWVRAPSRLAAERDGGLEVPSLSRVGSPAPGSLGTADGAVRPALPQPLPSRVCPGSSDDGAAAFETAAMQAQMRELIAALESWQPGSYAAVIDGGVSALWSGCATQQAAAVAAVSVLAASPVGCTAAANSHTLPRCLEMLAGYDACPGAAGISPGASETLPPFLGLAILRTLSRVVAGSREASVPLALAGGIPLLQGLGAAQHVCGWGARSLLGLEAERLLFEISTHPELTWPCLKHRVLTAAVGALMRTTRAPPMHGHAPVSHSDGKAGGRDARQAGAVQSRRGLRDEVPLPACGLTRFSSAPPPAHAVALGAHAALSPSSDTGAHTVPIACWCWDEHRVIEAAVRRAAAAAARVLVSPPQALLPLLAHNEVYAALALLDAAAHPADSSAGVGTAAESEGMERSAPCHVQVMRGGCPVGSPCGGCGCEGWCEGWRYLPCGEAGRRAAADASRTASEVTSHMEARLRDHCARQGWLLHSRLDGAIALGVGVGGAAGAWHIGVADGGAAPAAASPWRASGGEMRTTGAERCHPDRLSVPQLHAALMLVRFSPLDDAAGIRAFFSWTRPMVGATLSHAAMLPPLRNALLRHLMSPPQFLGESTGPGASAGFAAGCSAAACTLAGVCGYSAHAADSGFPCSAPADREERVACASVLRHALMQRVHSMGAAAPLALRAAAAVLAAVGLHGVPDNAYARALVESQVGLILEGGS
mmetsp:Transcript_34176/g.110403  ORF Transcript_34176/g.110403 Transcript_34176/m.110403 type:complete len:1274 (+) Transcript_34176:55-3876(+)